MYEYPVWDNQVATYSFVLGFREMRITEECAKTTEGGWVWDRTLDFSLDFVCTDIENGRGTCKIAAKLSVLFNKM